VQLHDKVQKLIEQYTIDKKRLIELEKKLKEKSEDSSGYVKQIDDLQKELHAANDMNKKLSDEIKDLKTKNLDLEKEMDLFENFADDINSKIDDLIPKIDKL